MNLKDVNLALACRHVVRPIFFMYIAVLLAACNVVYINSIDLESLTGPVAIAKAIEQTFAAGRSPVNTTVVHFKVNGQGITLTDSKRKYVPAIF